jgi:hypothetical protein
VLHSKAARRLETGDGFVDGALGEACALCDRRLRREGSPLAFM